MDLGEVLQSVGVVAGFFGLIVVCSDPHGPLPVVGIVGLVVFAVGFILRSDRPSPWRRRKVTYDDPEHLEWAMRDYLILFLLVLCTALVVFWAILLLCANIVRLMGG